MKNTDTARKSAKPLPVDVVFAPEWWHHHTGITFDEDFFYHPGRRVLVERQMEQELYDRFGQYGLGQARNEDRPEIGAVHLAAGFLVSEMLGCQVQYREDAPPQVVPAGLPKPGIPVADPFKSPAWKRLNKVMDAMAFRYGRLTGDVNWSGVLNLALDLRGQDIFIDMLDDPEPVEAFFADIARTIAEFSRRIADRTGSTSVSVNRLVRHRPGAVFLQSECSHTMISEKDYRRYLMPFDVEWSRTHRPYGIHFCGPDAHRFAGSFADLPHLDFLDVGWGGDVADLRRHLPNTFLNIRLDPVSLRTMPIAEIREAIRSRVAASGNPTLTGVCCINMDKDTPDAAVSAIFETVEECRREYALKTRRGATVGSVFDSRNSPSNP